MKNNQSSLLSTTNPTKIVEDLANFVIRAFYDDRHVVVFQYLITCREPKTDFELANKLNLPFGFTIKVLTQLSNDFLVHAFKDQVEGRDVLKYCIHYDTFLNVIQLRLHFLKEWVEEQAKEKIMGYYCKECNQGYDQFEVMKIINDVSNPSHSPICSHDDCNGEIVEDIEEFKERTGSEVPLSQVFEQDLGHISTLLKEAENLVVPTSSRSNCRSIVTKEEARRRNMIELKRQTYDTGPGGTSRRRFLTRSLALLESGDQIEVLGDEDQDDNGELNQMKDNTPFFLRKEEDDDDDDDQSGREKNNNSERNRNNSLNDQFNQSFLELLESGKKFQISDEKKEKMMDEEEEEEEIEEEEDNNIFVFVNNRKMRIEEIGFEEERMMTDEEYRLYSKNLNKGLDVEW